MLTFAQNFEDVLLARAFQGRSTGFYVDIGASHPEHLSVTKHFYDRGWRGVNVEPIPRAYERFLEARPRDINVNVAVGRARGEREFFECSDFDALSTFDPGQAEFLRKQGHTVVSYLVPTVTCDDIFERAGGVEVDFLKIDVEGAEREVVESLDLARYRPKVILLEAMAPGRPFPGWFELESVENWSAWEPRILGAGYRFAHFDGVSRFYVREDVAELARVFRLPVGMFDDVHFPEETRLHRREAELGERIASLEEAVVARDQHIRDEFMRAYGLEQDLDAARAALDTANAHAAKVQGDLDFTFKKLTEFETMRAWPAFKYAAYRFKINVRDFIFGRVWGFAHGRGGLGMPKITVVTPVRNAHTSIGETLESVLSQEYPALEYIVVDGGSTDGTLEIIRHYEARTDFPQRIARVISEPDEGMYDALGKGFAAATGEVLGYLNGDDLLEPGAMLGIGHHFAYNPGANAVYHEDTVMVKTWKYPNLHQPRRVTVDDLLGGHILFQDGVYFRKKLYDMAGGVRRDLRLAGDYDLWLRMCALSRFDRRAGHVSCFRVRGGQLSEQMDKYRAEMDRARADFLRGKGLLQRARWKAVGIANRLLERWKRWRRPDPLYFTMDFANMPPPAIEVVGQPGLWASRSPVDHAYAERLLFSTPDTRFGGREMHYIYYDQRNGITVTWPPVARDKLDGLYRKNYSAPPTTLGFPGTTSPYRLYDQRRIRDRLLLRVPVEWFHKYVRMPSWEDTTLEDLALVLRRARVDPGRPLRFLDTGCFDGLLLDRVRRETPWQAFGLEPNEQAVGIARSKGHEVWQAHAEDALDVVPRDRAFDVIYMGQSIEHVDDPLRVLRRLRLLLAPGGVLVCSTPNLDSRQIAWYGPTWAHWHPPYHRYIFSKRGFRALAVAAGLHVRELRTFSHPYWSAMTLAQRELGLDGVVSHAVDFEIGTRLRAQRIDFWSKRWWNHFGEGDYMFVVMAEDEHG